MMKTKREVIVAFRQAEQSSDTETMQVAFNRLLKILAVYEFHELFFMAEADSEDWYRICHLIARGLEAEKREIDAMQKQVTPPEM